MKNSIDLFKSLSLLFLMLGVAFNASAQNKSDQAPIPTPRGSFPVDPMEAVQEGRSTNTKLAQDLQSVSIPDLPSGWTSLSPEGNFKTGDADDANAGGYFPVPDIPGNVFAMANDDVCNCDMSNIRLISPSFDLSGLSGVAMVLRFNAFHDKNWGGGDATAQISIDGGSTWDTLMVLNSNTNWQYYVLDISSYTGNSNVKVKFQWSDDNTWASGFAVDNIVVDELLDNDLQVKKVWKTDMTRDLEYTALPLEQSREMTVGATVKNNGSDLQSNTKLAATLSRNGQVLHMDTSAASDLDSMQRDLYWVPTSFTPDSLGYHVVETEALSDQAEQYPQDNKKKDSVRFTCDHFARDRGNYDGSSLMGGEHSNGERIGYQAGNLFGVFSDAEAEGVRFLLDSASEAGASVRGVLHKLDTSNNSFDTVAVTDPYSIQSSDVSGISNPVWTELSFDSSISLDSGAYYMAAFSLMDSSSQKASLGTSGVVPHQTSYFKEDTSSSWKDVNAAPMIRLITPPFKVGLTEDTLVCADSSLTLDAGPGDAYIWNTGEQSRSIQASGPDTFSVTVTQGQCQRTDSVVVDTIEGCATGLEAYGERASLGIHPNPARDRLHIDEGPKVRIRALTVRDLDGSFVRSFDPKKRTLSLKGLAEGIYLLRVRTLEGMRVERFVKE